ncbi:DNA-binding CsgD family transcriptional regulator [Agrobacterium vitis]|nr:DNA-binding CsgD family transcriptional regulator [Agrobacterium vitis]MBE1438165.1 DNA-binding CsgD family transcriptional regulator [Agrobacterium vitis]
MRRVDKTGDETGLTVAAPQEVSSRALDVERFLAELSSSKTQFDVFRFMKRIAEYFGVKFFMVMNLPPVQAINLAMCSVISNWPAELLTEYDQAGLLPTSPIFHRLRNTSIPVVFDLAMIARERDARTVNVAIDILKRHGLIRNACFPVYDSASNRGAVAISGDIPEFSFTDLVLLHYISTHVFNRLAEIRDLDARVTESLTEREIECLTWTSAGKTSIEIAEIMGLSEHTINHYLNRATKKLDTVNRTQAVAKSLRLGLIK